MAEDDSGDSDSGAGDSADSGDSEEVGDTEESGNFDEPSDADESRGASDSPESAEDAAAQPEDTDAAVVGEGDDPLAGDPDEPASAVDQDADQLVATDSKEDVPAESEDLDKDAAQLDAEDRKEDVPKAESEPKAQGQNGGRGAARASGGGGGRGVSSGGGQAAKAPSTAKPAIRPASKSVMNAKAGTAAKAITPIKQPDDPATAHPAARAEAKPGQASSARDKMSRKQPSPLWTKLIYGFYDDRDRWQQAGPLTWEEAGHQIAAAISLGRHPFVWDGGLRQWRPLVTEPEHGASAVHSALGDAGWSPEQRAAVLRGPEAWRQHLQTGLGHTDHIVNIDPKQTHG